MKKSSAIPLQFKVLISLKILARGNDFDTILELSGVPLLTCHRIFNTFIKSFTINFFNEYVHMPTGDKLTQCMNTYKLLGFNGCVGSIDCTHIYWSKCPKELVNFCIGKRGSQLFHSNVLLIIIEEYKCAVMPSVEQLMIN